MSRIKQLDSGYKKSIGARCELSNFVLLYNWDMCSNSQEGLFIILLYWVQIYRKISTPDHIS